MSNLLEKTQKLNRAIRRLYLLKARDALLQGSAHRVEAARQQMKEIEQNMNARPEVQAALKDYETAWHAYLAADKLYHAAEDRLEVLTGAQYSRGAFQHFSRYETDFVKYPEAKKWLDHKAEIPVFESTKPSAAAKDALTVFEVDLSLARTVADAELLLEKLKTENPTTL